MRLRVAALILIASLVGCVSAADLASPSVAPSPTEVARLPAGGSPIETPSPLAPPSASANVSPSQSENASHRVQIEGIAIDVPALWTVRTSRLNEHYITIVGFVGTAPSSAGCQPESPLPTRATSGFECSTDLALGPGDVSIEVMTVDGPGALGPLDYTQHLAAGARLIDVDGVPAVLNPNDADYAYAASANARDASLTLAIPATTGSEYVLVGAARGPGLDALMTQVLGAFGSVHYVPPITALPTSAAARLAVAQRAVAQLKTEGSAFACFPAIPGTAVQATITQVPAYGTSFAPIAATCRTDLTVLPIELWQLTLTEQWGPAGGVAVTTAYLAADGTPQEVVGPSTSPP